MTRKNHMEALQPDTQPLPDYFPRIIIDKGLGEHLSDIDVNFGAINTTFLEQGMTPEQISETTIHIIDTPASLGKRVVEYGHYTAKIQQIELYPAAKIERNINAFRRYTGDSREFSKERDGKYLGYSVSEVLRHEMEHRIVDAEGGMREQTLHVRCMQAETIGVYATCMAGLFALTDMFENLRKSQTLTEFALRQASTAIALGIGGLLVGRRRAKHYYRTSPEENRAFDVQEPPIGQHWPFITMRLRYQDEP